MPTKAELEEQVEELKRSVAAYKGRITKLENEGASSDEVRELCEKACALVERMKLRSTVQQTGAQFVDDLEAASDAVHEVDRSALDWGQIKRR